MNNRFKPAEKGISELEDRSVEIMPFEEQRRIFKNELSQRDPWNIIKHKNKHNSHPRKGGIRKMGKQNIWKK